MDNQKKITLHNPRVDGHNDKVVVTQIQYQVRPIEYHRHCCYIRCSGRLNISYPHATPAVISVVAYIRNKKIQIRQYVGIVFTIIFVTLPDTECSMRSCSRS